MATIYGGGLLGGAIIQLREWPATTQTPPIAWMLAVPACPLAACVELVPQDSGAEN